MRGEEVRALGLPLPPPGEPALGRGAPPLSLLHGRRPLKRWRWVGAFGPELMLCAGDARIGPLPQRWWAIAVPDGPLIEGTGVRERGLMLSSENAGSVRLRLDRGDIGVDLVIDRHSDVEPVEVVSRSDDAWIWTRKEAGVPATGTVRLHGECRRVELEATIDDSAGYHARHTKWRWSTGVGRAKSGEGVAWNLVAGVHDADAASERALWIDGAAGEVGPISFAGDLSRVRFVEGGELRFAPWAERAHRTRLAIMSSDYRQPFGSFSGDLPGGLRLERGYGVMEEHDARW